MTTSCLGHPGINTLAPWFDSVMASEKLKSPTRKERERGKHATLAVLLLHHLEPDVEQMTSNATDL